LNANEDIKLEKLKISQQIARQNWGGQTFEENVIREKTF
jgi:hypothetical protein